jgi:putative ABC transport system substrate-binding protein
MRRRDFITLLGGAAAWPIQASAQQRMPVIGFMNSTSPEVSANLVAAFRRGLSEAGYVEGRNVAIEYRYAEGQLDRLPAFAADLVRRQVAVIVATTGQAVRAAQGATATIPIVFTTGGDPVQGGYVASLNRPGGNLTGVTVLAVKLAAKRLELLHELVPKATVIAMLHDGSLNPELEDVQEAVRSLGLQLHVLNARTDRDVDVAFAKLADLRVDALFVPNSVIFATRREQIVALAALHSVPASYDRREYTVAGGLMSYGTNFANSYRQAGAYAGRILKGEKPADLPVMQPTEFELVINLKTAKALGITVPTSMQLLADEVIE